MGQISPQKALSWQEELRRAIRTTRELSKFLGHPLEETPYPVLIPPSLAHKIRQFGPDSALWRQFVPHPDEGQGGGLIDPIGDQSHAVGGQLIHRYPNRALFLPTPICPVNCRYCFRKNELASPDALFSPDLEKALTYLREHPQIEEIIYSGGDPFVLSNSKLEESLSALAEIPSLKYLRFHTRIPVILPQRFDSHLQELLCKASERFELVSLVSHINHPEEIDAQVRQIFSQLKKLPSRLLTQSVLLRGVNDNVPCLKKLFLQIASLGATPYYLHHPDPVLGGAHFELPLEEGCRLYLALKRQLPAQTLPHYVRELPRGEGKVHCLDNREENWEKGQYVY